MAATTSATASSMGTPLRCEPSRYRKLTAPAVTSSSPAISPVIVVFEPILVVKYHKVKFLEAKGFDASAARLELDTMFNARTGRDTGAPILNAAGGGGGYPYLNSFRNVGDTGYGV